MRNLATTPRPPRMVMLRQMVLILQSIVTLPHQAGYRGTSQALRIEMNNLFLSCSIDFAWNPVSQQRCNNWLWSLQDGYELGGDPNQSY